MDNESNHSRYVGHVKNGVIVLDDARGLQEGQAVVVEPLPENKELSPEERAEKLRLMRQLFAEWTEEDSKLSDEEAGRLRVALEQSRGLAFRTPKLD